MTKFILHFNILEENIEQYKSCKNNINSNLNSYYNMLMNIDYAWNDNNSKIFKQNVKKDRENVNNYLKYLEDYYRELETFKNNILGILSTYGRPKSTVINYNSSRIQECLNYLGDAIGNLNEARGYVANIVYPSDFVELDLVDELLNELRNIKNDIDRYDDDICNLSNGILDEINESRYRKSRISTFSGSFIEHTYNWSNVHMDDIRYRETNIEQLKVGRNTNSYNTSNISTNNSYSKIEQKSSNAQEINKIPSLKENTEYSNIENIKVGSKNNANNSVLSKNSNYSNIETRQSNSQNIAKNNSIDKNKQYSNFDEVKADRKNEIEKSELKSNDFSDMEFETKSNNIVDLNNVELEGNLGIEENSVTKSVIEKNTVNFDDQLKIADDTKSVNSNVSAPETISINSVDLPN